MRSFYCKIIILPFYKPKLIKKNLLRSFVFLMCISIFAQNQNTNPMAAQLLQTFQIQSQPQGIQQVNSARLLVAGAYTGEFNSEGIKLTTSNTNFLYNLEITSIKDDVEDINIKIMSFNTPDGPMLKPKWAISEQDIDKKIIIKALTSVTLTISASLPISGFYKSDLILIYDKFFGQTLSQLNVLVHSLTLPQV